MNFADLYLIEYDFDSRKNESKYSCCFTSKEPTKNGYGSQEIYKNKEIIYSYFGDWCYDHERFGKSGIGCEKFFQNQNLIETYTGGMLQGQRNGHGILTINGGDCYVGEWSSGQNHGAGEIIYFNGNKYIGDQTVFIYW